MKLSYLKLTLIVVSLCIATVPAFGQEKNKIKLKGNKTYKKEFCSGRNWSSDSRVSVKSLRELNLSAGDVDVDSKNGRITVIGEQRSDVLIRACVRAWGDDEAEAKSIVDSVTIETAGTITAEVDNDYRVSVAYEIRVPNSTNLNLSSNNGRISIKDVDGQIRFKTQNGRVTLSGLSGDVEGRTTNGRLTVKLDGNSWEGRGMNVSSGNGRVSVYIPENYAGDFEVGTNNGRFSSSFSELPVPLDENGKRKKYGAKIVTGSLNGGGAPIKVRTRNGRVSVNKY